MTICKDNSIAHLNSLGYNIVRLPKKGITPLTILIIDPSNPLVATVYGSIPEIVTDSSIPLPKVFENLEIGEINGERTSRLDFGLGITFLKILLSAMDGKSARIESAFKDANQIEFEYSGVVYDTVMPTSVASFLKSNKPLIDEHLLTEFNAEGKAYIVIDVLKSNRFCIRAYKEGNTEVDIDVNPIKAIVGTESKIIVEKKEDLAVVFKGEKALGFGVKVCPFWIEIADGKSQFMLRPQTNVFDGEVRGSAEHAIAPTLGDPDVLTPVLIAPNRLIQFA